MARALESVGVKETVRPGTQCGGKRRLLMDDVSL
jgi:hypothetical protein